MSSICIVLPDFQIIGAQRVAIDYGIKLTSSGYDVRWLIGEPSNSPDGVDKSKISYFDAKIFAKIKIARIIERFTRLLLAIAFGKYDKLFSVTPLLNRFVCVSALLKLFSGRIIIEDHAYPPKSYKDEFPSYLKRVFFEKTEWLYKYASVMRVLSLDASDYYRGKVLGINVIPYPNLMNFKRILDLSNQSADVRSYDIVYIGRFETQKNIIGLIKILAKYLKSNNGKMLIIGYGSLKSEIINLILKLDIKEFVDVLPSSDLNYKYLKNAKAFPMVSIWEGYPLVLIEAMRLGVPVVSYDCKTGPREIIGENSERGWLIEEGDYDAFISAIDSAINNNDLRNAKINKALEYVKSKNDINLNFQEYIEIFIEGGN